MSEYLNGHEHETRVTIKASHISARNFEKVYDEIKKDAEKRYAGWNVSIERENTCRNCETPA